MIDKGKVLEMCKLTDKYMLVALCKKLKLNLVQGDNTPDKNQYIVEDRTLIMGAGEGYSGFVGEFTFDSNGNIIKHAFYE